MLQAMDDFLPKPFSSAQFGETVLRAAAARTASAAAERTRSSPADERDPARAGELGPDGGPAVTAPEVAPPEPPLDSAIYAALAARFRPGQLNELYALTLDDVARRHAQMAALAAAGDLPAVQREAHAIKGLCGMVGARELLVLAAAVEGGTTLNTSALADFPAASMRLRRKFS